jgi:formylglycine-generating enzyme required for sulfatase activity
VNFVAWGSAARFCNWLSNGQPIGNQDASTTEDGSYDLNGATSGADLAAVTRKNGALYVIPTEDEWYKAAYYDPNKPGGAGYWSYPTRSDTPPSNAFSATETNNANYTSDDGPGNGYTIGDPYYRTEASAFAGSPGPWGTFDQGGNVFEWIEAVLYPEQDAFRGVRGGGYLSIPDALRGSFRGYSGETNVDVDTMIGFRVACLPEPTSVILLAAGVALLRRHPRK